MTVYIATRLHTPATPDELRGCFWKPWINCADEKETVAMAAKRAFRISYPAGPVDPHGNARFPKLFVYSYVEGTRLNPDGSPSACNFTEFTLVPETNP